VLTLAGRAGRHHPPRITLDVGCGDGALLCELRRARGSAGACRASRSPTRRSRSHAERAEIDVVACFDGVSLAEGDAAYEPGHPLRTCSRHVPDPPALLAEGRARSCRTVVVEVPLRGQPVSGGARQKREHGRPRSATCSDWTAPRCERSSRRAGLEIACELEDALPLSVQRFFAESAPARACGERQVGAAEAAFIVSRRRRPRRLFTVHYACLLPAGRRSAGEQQREHLAHSARRGTAAGSASFWARDPVGGGASIANGQLFPRGISQLEVELAKRPSSTSLVSIRRTLREARGDLRPDLRRRARRKPQNSMNSSSSSGSRLDHRHPLPRSAGGALGDGLAHADGLRDLARGVLVDLTLHEHQEEVLLAVEVGVQGARWRSPAREAISSTDRAVGSRSRRRPLRAAREQPLARGLALLWLAGHAGAVLRRVRLGRRRRSARFLMSGMLLDRALRYCDSVHYQF